MAYLVKCPVCDRDVSSDANACPGCGHNVAGELLQREKNKIENRVLGNWGSTLPGGHYDRGVSFRYAIKGDGTFEMIMDETTFCGTHYDEITKNGIYHIENSKIIFLLENGSKIKKVFRGDTLINDDGGDLWVRI